jgi:transposase-like protein
MSLIVAPALSTWERFKATPEASMEAVCAMMAEGKSLRACARELGVNNWTLLKWVIAAPERAQRFDAARVAQAEFYKEELQAIHEEPVRRTDKGNLDPADVALKRLKADNLKWITSRLAPKRYGDRIEVEAKVEHDVVGELRDHLRASRLPVSRREGGQTIDRTAQGVPLVREKPG